MPFEYTCACTFLTNRGHSFSKTPLTIDVMRETVREKYLPSQGDAPPAALLRVLKLVVMELFCAGVRDFVFYPDTISATNYEMPIPSPLHIPVGMRRGLHKSLSTCLSS